jgi:hypothetical protein
MKFPDLVRWPKRVNRRPITIAPIVHNVSDDNPQLGTMWNDLMSGQPSPFSSSVNECGECSISRACEPMVSDVDACS